MKVNIYEGVIDGQRKQITVNGEVLLYPFDEPNWNYVGVGPSKVAEAIMVNELGVGVDQEIINCFLEDKIAKLPGRENWILTSAEIECWLQESGHA